MKKTFLATRNTLLSSANISWSTAALTVATLAFLLRLLAPNVFWYTFTPLFHTADTFTAKGSAFLSSFSDTAVLAIKNKQLIDQNAVLAAQNQTLLQKEANILELFNSAPVSQGSQRGIVAGVVARPPESPYDTLVLAAGSLDGVVLGQEAFGAGGVPLGVVSSTLDHFSRVTLFSSSGRTTSGWVGNVHTALAVIGTGGGTMRAITPRSARVALGDTVFISGPGMLPVGAVVRIDGNSSSPSVTLRIQPTLNLFSVTWVVLRDTGTKFLLSATSTPL